MRSRASVIVLASMMLVAACSSKNPDALNAANLDENYATGGANLAENVDAAAGNAAAPAAPAGAPPANEAANSFQANVDAAVNTLKQAEANQNEYCEAQQEATGESDCDEN